MIGISEMLNIEMNKLNHTCVCLMILFKKKALISVESLLNGDAYLAIFS